MKIVTRQLGGEMCVSDTLMAVVLELSGGRAKLGLTSRSRDESKAGAIATLPRVPRTTHAYYRCSRTGVCMLVLEVLPGQRVTTDQSESIVVLDIRRASITLALCPYWKSSTTVAALGD